MFLNYSCACLIIPSTIPDCDTHRKCTEVFQLYYETYSPATDVKAIQTLYHDDEKLS